jgi:secreted PhoX family phosphatase
VYFTTKGDNRVWRYRPATETVDLLYDAADAANQPDPVLTGVDNVIVSRSGDVYVAEDGGNLEVVVITPDNVVAPVVRATGRRHGFDNPLPPPFSEIPTESEISGLAFSPSGRRLYFNSQRGNVLGITYEVRGPFRATA